MEINKINANNSYKNNKSNINEREVNENCMNTLPKHGAGNLEGNIVTSQLDHVRQTVDDDELSVQPLKIEYNAYRSVKSFNSRIRFIVMHYTALNFKDSVNALTGNSVSAHYLVPDPTEQSYIDAGFNNMRVFNLVDEKERAWHAGNSSWANRTNINDTSIGIEIVNLASDDGHGNITYPAFNAVQVNTVKALALNIIQRYPDITPVNIVGHSDIAPGRKNDPGAAFPWEELYASGIGAWFDQRTKEKYESQFQQALPAEREIILKLKEYGYDVTDADSDKGRQGLIRAFQLHFRQSDYSGIIDIETAAILYALVEKYFHK
ncbi:N-acetylmuramoyl-L-alanine amidase [Pectobacterium parvum]|uniref:N-acetylmuramoyl-L-alanine amidase n=1 Tax=Pectobacterium TaxID=122277 RepID=UPI000DC648A3|nr:MULTISPECIES: N-acetylmuramoyl-L-alanine amidase [Pectobacterium]UFK41177.1 N-acetylmuramoyl-L-alanine amidase [Pectobacterium parvum]UVD99314.1 N-acetylmuramoyl-L-alanine amidase [Pectobacterium parvum]GKW43195.1 N-acetylmuramoyl-L-alanine amidase [Pectobacterium carotovorum subsp. carotovorum]